MKKLVKKEALKNFASTALSPTQQKAVKGGTAEGIVISDTIMG